VIYVRESHAFGRSVFGDDFAEKVARYRDQCWQVINDDVKVHGKMDGYPSWVDSRCVWFSLDTLKKFLCYIEKYSDSIHIDRDSLGVRFYYAVISGDTVKEAHKDRVGQHTIFMVPTEQRKGEPIDFDPVISFNEGKGQIAYLSEHLNPETLILALGGGVLNRLM
jgi:hypothetical protein